MPKQTFYNLPDEKRQKIIDAARKEFIRVPFADASINQIVKNSDISRGSFYQYFEDKEDVFFSVMNEYVEKFLKGFFDVLESSHGEIFECVEMYILDILNCECSGMDFKSDLPIDGLCNILSNPLITKRIWNSIPDEKDSWVSKIPFDYYEKIDINSLNIESVEELNTLLEILGIIAREALAEYFVSLVENEQGSQNLDNKIIIINKFTNRINTLKRHYKKV